MVHQSFEELYLVDKSSLQGVFFKKSVLKIFSKFTGEHPCRSEISIELFCNIKITLLPGCSPVSLLHFCKYKKQKIVCLIFYFNTICKRYTVTKQITYFFYKQLGSGLSPQSCLFFQVAWGLKLLNGCLLVWPSNLCLQEYSNFEDSRPMFKISDFNFLPKMLLRQLNFGAFIGLTAILCLLQRKNSAFL